MNAVMRLLWGVIAVIWACGSKSGQCGHVVSVVRDEFDLYLGWKALADKGYSAKIKCNFFLSHQLWTKSFIRDCPGVEGWVHPRDELVRRNDCEQHNSKFCIWRMGQFKSGCSRSNLWVGFQSIICQRKFTVTLSLAMPTSLHSKANKRKRGTCLLIWLWQCLVSFLGGQMYIWVWWWWWRL